MKAKLLKLYRAATAQQWADGYSWYKQARELCDTMAMEYNTTRSLVAGVIAALSPRQHWKRNVSLARSVLGGIMPRGCFKANLDKAWRIRCGEAPSHVLKGDKVRAFYEAILGFDRPVVDTWVMRAVGMPDKKCTPKLYARVSGALEKCASEVCIPVAAFQAIIWCVLRGRSF